MSANCNREYAGSRSHEKITPVNKTLYFSSVIVCKGGYLAPCECVLSRLTLPGGSLCRPPT